VVFIVFPNNEPTHLQAPLSDVKSVTIDPQMAIILVHVRKNIVEDVLLEGGSSVNIIIEDLKKKLGLLISKPTPYTLRMVD
jgi:Ethanolamine utilization protein EutJ (predicted chaperonin)